MAEDIILLDDEELVRSYWERRFHHARRAIRIFRDPAQLIEAAASIHHNAMLFIDKNLGKQVSGLSFSKHLFDLGYKTIYVSTAEDLMLQPQVDWIKGFIGKTPPYWLFKNQLTAPLNSAERNALISQMSPQQLETYRQRIQKYLEISYGMDSGAFAGPSLHGFNIPEVVMHTWERAITLSMSDEDIKSATDYSWSLI